MAGVGVGGDEVACARGDLQGKPGSSGEDEHRGAGAGEAPPDPRWRLAEVGFQGRQGDFEALWSSLVRAARPQEMGPDRTGGSRSGEGDPVKHVTQGGLEVTGPNVASKPPRIGLKARSGR